MAYEALTRARITNLEAPIPPQCYTKSDGTSNPCWTCHAVGTFPNRQNDVKLQSEYAFSDVGKDNHWTNLFVDRSAVMASITDAQALAYVRQDNYAELRTKLAGKQTGGYIPDLDFQQGFGEDGFAKDGSGWRAFRYKPFPGAFWPTNGATDDVLIRLPASFRKVKGVEQPEVYKANLALLEAQLATDPNLPADKVVWPTEPLDEKLVGADLDGDGKRGVAVLIKGLPKKYFGDAAALVFRGVYPHDTEFLHSVRYIDPESRTLIAQRMKELRYSRKVRYLGDTDIPRAYAAEVDEKFRAHLPRFAGDGATGLVNGFGWRYQAFIEDSKGRLRAQTREETFACMGCHANLGVTVDGSFSFPRKVPGKSGWAYQNIGDIPDVPQWGHAEGEVLTYFKRVLGGDEFRSNDEILERFFPGGKLDEALVKKAAVGGTEKLPFLLAPSRKRALLLNKAYMALVREQTFEKGRDVVIRPAKNVLQHTENVETAFAKAGHIYADGQLRLNWRGTPFWTLTD